ncbi:MAG: (5-formylfuran-3-yl)methyl phosphate synthase [Pirellulales bacterium]
MSAHRVSLMVSVRNAEEAGAALAGGADWIDVKEPARGALGAAESDVVREVLAAVDGRCPVSAALGELDDLSPSELHKLPPGISHAKIGLARSIGLHDWPRRWRQACRLHAPAAPVAVVYADWQAAGAPAPWEVLKEARVIGCKTVLIDTYFKHGASLFNAWPAPQLGEFCQSVREHGSRLVLAGSLAAESISLAVALAPDLVAVRGAVCRAGRQSQICEQRVRALAHALRATCDTCNEAVSREHAW